MTLEKQISYSQATLNPETELEKFENNSKIRLKPLNNLGALWHCDDTDGYVYGDSIYTISIKDACYGLRLHAIGGYTYTQTTTKKLGTRAVVSYRGGLAGHLPADILQNPPKSWTVELFFRWDDILYAGNYFLFGQWDNLRDQGKLWRLVATTDATANTITALIFEMYDSTDTLKSFTVTLGTPLQPNTWYHISASYNSETGIANIFVDGTSIGSQNLGIMRSSPNKQALTFHCIVQNGSLNQASVYNNNFYDEICIWNYARSANFTPPTSPIIPFSITHPTATVILDSGYIDTNWNVNSLTFFDETYWNSGNLKIRGSAGNTEPTLSGDPMTLAEFRNYGFITGRYLKLEFTFISDGNQQVELTAGDIEFSIAGPSKPVISNFSRNGDTGSCEVSGVDDDTIVYAYCRKDFDPHCPKKLIGQRIGNGTITLDYSQFKINLGSGLGNIELYYPGKTYLVAYKNGLWSADSDYAEPTFFTFDAPTISNYKRTASTATFTVSGMTTGMRMFVMWTDVNNEIQSLMITEDGNYEITGLRQDWNYTFIPILNPVSGQIGFALPFGDTPTTPPTTGPIKERIVQNIVDTLAGIKPAYGYYTDVKEVERIKRSMSAGAVGDRLGKSLFPHLFVIIQEESTLAQILHADFGYSDQQLNILICGWLDDDEIEEACTKLISDIEKALLADITRGGLAWLTEIKSKNWEVDESKVIKQQPMGLIYISVVVKYRHKYGDPNTQ